MTYLYFLSLSFALIALFLGPVLMFVAGEQMVKAESAKTRQFYFRLMMLAFVAFVIGVVGATQ
jgi:hypothetical protein